MRRPSTLADESQIAYTIVLAAFTKVCDLYAELAVLDSEDFSAVCWVIYQAAVYGTVGAAKLRE